MERCPPKRYAEVLTPSASECDLWKQGHCRRNELHEEKVIPGSPGPLIRYGRCPVRGLGRHAHEEEGRVALEAETEMMCPQAQEHWGLPEAGQGPALGLQRTRGPAPS